MRKLIWITVFLLLGCNTQSSITCAEIRDNPVLKLRAQHITYTHMLDWVTTHYEVDRDSILAGEISSTQTRVAWEVENVFHEVKFTENNPDVIQITFSPRRVTGQEVINCLGNPDLYRARVKQEQDLSLYYSFLYVDEGIEISGGRGVEGVEPNTLMIPEISFYQVEIHESGTIPTVQEWESWKRWTSWEQIEVDRQPD